MVGEVAYAAGECARNYLADEEVYVRVHAYVKYSGSDWNRLGSDMRKVKAEQAYETAGKLTQEILSEGVLANITYAERKAFKVVLDNGNGKICRQDIGAEFLPLD